MLAEGGLSERARKRAEELAIDADVRTTPPRSVTPVSTKPNRRKTPVRHDARVPKPGVAITREYKGRTIEVRVVRDGFEYDGERFKSLSAVAKAVTGSHCSGYRFFSLEGKS